MHSPADDDSVGSDAVNGFNDSMDFTLSQQILLLSSQSARSQPGSHRPSPGVFGQGDVIRRSLGELDRVTKPTRQTAPLQLTPIMENRTTKMLMMPTPHATPRNVSMSFTNVLPDFSSTGRNSIFMDLTNAGYNTTLSSPALELSQWKAQTGDDGRTLQALQLPTIQEPGPDDTTAVVKNLFSMFHQCYTARPNHADVLELVKSYELACQALIDQLTPMVKHNDAHKHDVLAALNIVSLECATWELIHVLFSDRLSSCSAATGNQEDGTIMDDTLGDLEMACKLSSKQVVDRFFERDSGVRQCELVIDWLEKLAGPKLEASINIFHATDKVAWEHTLNELQSGVTNPRIVSSLDPDAPLREKKPLSDFDKAEEQVLNQHLFRCVRAGELAKAQEICCKLGQHWRAAILDGWKLFHDPNLTDEGYTDGVGDLEGNYNRGLWAESCWHMIREAGLDDYENAIFATLIGDLEYVLPVCDSWHDYLWAYYKSMVNAIVEQQLSITPGRGEDEVFTLSTQAILGPELIFQELRACKVKSVQQGAVCPYRIAQRDVILNNMQSLINEMSTALRRNPDDWQLLRFMAHIVLFIKSLGVATAEDNKCVEILEAFVKCLVRVGQGELVAVYAAALPYEMQVKCYSDLLEQVTVSSTRHVYLQLAEEAGLDTACITCNVVQNICSNWDDDCTHTQSSLGMGDADITPDDENKIKSIEWLTFDPAQRQDVLKESNTLIRAFIARGKYLAAVQVFSMVPSDAQKLIVAQWNEGSVDGELPANIANTIHEHSCIQAYLDAHDAFNTWFGDFHRGKPSAPRLPSAGGASVEQFGYSEKQKMYQKEVDQWKILLTHSTQDSVQRLRKVLTFGPDGWMVDPYLVEDNEGTREIQMKLLRQLCLPKICFLLHTVLHSAGRYRECVEIGDIVSSQRYQLYEVFQQDDLRRLLSLIAESNIEIADKDHINAF